MFNDTCIVNVAKLYLALTSTLENYSTSYWVVCLKLFLKISESATRWRQVRSHGMACGGKCHP